MLVCLSCRELPTKEFSCKNSLSVYNFLLETICLYMIRPLHLQLKCQVSFFSQYTIDHYCLCCWVKNIWGRFFSRKHNSRASQMFYNRKYLGYLRFPFLMGAYYLWVKIVGAVVVWEHGNICLGKKSHRSFRPKK